MNGCGYPIGVLVGGAVIGAAMFGFLGALAGLVTAVIALEIQTKKMPIRE